MLYMVELDFAQPARKAEWDAWYMHHLEVLLAVPGIRTAQRFSCTSAHAAPYLAVYTVDSPEVFASAAYCARGGRDSTGEWRSSMVNWDRNVFAGLDRAPAVAAGERLLMTEDERLIDAHADVAFRRLAAVGLDRTVARRCIAVADEKRALRVTQASDGQVRAYRPLMEQRIAGGG